MFQEREEGQPKRWGCLVAIIIIVTFINLSIVISIRAILDSEDEINVPIIQGKLRDDLTYFLGVFTMSFFFGCYCCFCCGCACCRWCFVQVPENAKTVWNGIPKLFINNIDQLPIHRLREEEINDHQEDFVANARGILAHKMEQKDSDKRAYENSAYDDIFEMENIEMPRRMLPPPLTGRPRSQSIDISSIA